MKPLVIIPARGGSKGIPGKNIRLLNGKPLLHYTLAVARQLAPISQICVSTDDAGIAEASARFGVPVPFMRPPQLATDSAGTYPVLLHALEFYAGKDYYPDTVILLQPTSPFRTAEQVKEALKQLSAEADMVASVKETRANPYFVLYEENQEGYLEKSKTGEKLNRRQEAPKVYELNGAIYLINVSSLRKYNSFAEFPRIRKFEMDELSSVDIDTELDWQFSEFLLEKGHVKGNSTF